MSDVHVTMARETEHHEMAPMLEFLQDSGVGYLPEHKGNGWVWLMFETWSSIGTFTHSWKIDQLNYLVRQ
jgi:hypothetical protein